MSEAEELEMDKEEVLKECFELVRVLGEGSFGKVYLIRNKETSTLADMQGRNTRSSATTATTSKRGASIVCW